LRQSVVVAWWRDGVAAGPGGSPPGLVPPSWIVTGPADAVAMVGAASGAMAASSTATAVLKCGAPVALTPRLLVVPGRGARFT